MTCEPVTSQVHRMHSFFGTGMDTISYTVSFGPSNTTFRLLAYCESLGFMLFAEKFFYGCEFSIDHVILIWGYSPKWISLGMLLLSHQAIVPSDRLAAPWSTLSSWERAIWSIFLSNASKATQFLCFCGSHVVIWAFESLKCNCLVCVSLPNLQHLANSFSS